MCTGFVRPRTAISFFDFQILRRRSLGQLVSYMGKGVTTKQTLKDHKLNTVRMKQTMLLSGIDLGQTWALAVEDDGWT